MVNSLKKLVGSTSYPIFAFALFAGITSAIIKVELTDQPVYETGPLAQQCASGRAEWLELDAHQCNTNPWERGLKAERHLECVWRDLTTAGNFRSRAISEEDSHHRAIQYYRNRGVIILNLRRHEAKGLLCAMMCSETCGVYKVLACSGHTANKRMLGFRSFGAAYQKLGLDADGRHIN